MAHLYTRGSLEWKFKKFRLALSSCSLSFMLVFLSWAMLLDELAMLLHQMRRFSDPFLLDLDNYVLFLYKLCRRGSKGRKVGYSGTCFELFVRQIYSTLILNGKDILMVILSLLSCSFSFLAWDHFSMTMHCFLGLN